MLKYRLISAFILIMVVIVTLFSLSFLPFAAASCIVCILAAWEWGRLAGITLWHHRLYLTLFFTLLLGMVVFFMLFSPALCTLQAQIMTGLVVGWWITALILLLAYPFSVFIWHKQLIVHIFFGILTIIPFFWGLLTLQQETYLYNNITITGAWRLLYIMILIWSADSGAYMFGKLWGKHKLAPKISPGKTWEGVMGGLVTTLLCSYLMKYWLSLDIAWQKMFIFAVIAVLVSILGDLSESMFKREAGVKESGYLIPGHGGILDRIDSLTAAVPIFACLMPTLG